VVICAITKALLRISIKLPLRIFGARDGSGDVQVFKPPFPHVAENHTALTPLEVDTKITTRASDVWRDLPGHGD
jgi:hypothetical protein